MPISKEKMAQITAGADPKSVLNAEELKQYKAMVDNVKGSNPTDMTVETTPSQSDDKKGEGSEEKPSDKPQDAEPKNSDGMLDKLLALNTENATLAVKLQNAEAENATLAATLSTAQQETKSLRPLAEAVVLNLQTALMKPKQVEGTVAGLVEQYVALKEEQARTFSTGRQSSTKTADDDVNDPALEATIDRLARAANANKND